MFTYGLYLDKKKYNVKVIYLCLHISSFIQCFYSRIQYITVVSAVLCLANPIYRLLSIIWIIHLQLLLCWRSWYSLATIAKIKFYVQSIYTSLTISRTSPLSDLVYTWGLKANVTVYVKTLLVCLFYIVLHKWM